MIVPKMLKNTRSHHFCHAWNIMYIPKIIVSLFKNSGKEQLLFLISFFRHDFAIDPLNIVRHFCIHSGLVDPAASITPADNSIQVRDLILLTSQWPS